MVSPSLAMKRRFGYALSSRHLRSGNFPYNSRISLHAPASSGDQGMAGAKCLEVLTGPLKASNIFILQNHSWHFLGNKSLAITRQSKWLGEIRSGKTTLHLLMTFRGPCAGRCSYQFNERSSYQVQDGVKVFLVPLAGHTWWVRCIASSICAVFLSPGNFVAVLTS